MVFGNNPFKEPSVRVRERTPALAHSELRGALRRRAPANPGGRGHPLHRMDGVPAPTAPAAPTEKPPQPVPRWRRLLVRIALGAGTLLALLLLAGLGFCLWVEHACTFPPPPLPAGNPALAEAVKPDGPGLRRCGACWVHEDEGIREIYLEGDAVARGFGMASLCRETLDAQEDQLFHDLDRLLPGRLRRFVLLRLVMFAYRDLRSYLEDAEMLEAAAMVPALERGGPRPQADVLPVYQRVLFYQTLYDTGQAMAEAGLVDTAIECTSFAASGAATKSGRLVLGRNCDFEAGSIFDDRKLVYFVVPAEGARYACVSWAGMIGVVSGVNEHGLVLMLHAARTESTRTPSAGRPVPFILRDALLHDRTIEEVADRFRRSPRHAAAMVLVAEGATGRSAVIETDPTRTAVLEARDGVIACANTLRDPGWKDDAVVAATGRAGSSPLRLARMEELVGQSRGRLDAAEAARILRDRRGLGGADIGLGNRTALSALIAAHAIVYDAAAGVLHVSRAPRGLGEFVAYDTARFFRGGRPRVPEDLRVPGPAAIPAAGDLGAPGRAAKAAALLGESRAALARGDAGAALSRASEAAAADEDSPESLLAEAEAYLAAGRAGESRAAAARALQRQPVPGPERSRLLTLAKP